MSEIIPLNIVFSYPVNWDKYQILRDFVQNFYDDVEPVNWKESFHYKYDKELRLLWMGINNGGFSYEWLLHIGASTKTNDETIHAGYFGEGFKIASLCAIRDFKWKIAMFSRNWKLSVQSVSQKIDGKAVEMLAYGIEQSEYLQGSRLEIQNVSEEDYNLFLIILDSFYFPQNNLFGKKIWESDRAAVYERSSNPINENLPKTYKCGSKGAVFCGYQMLGTNPLPLVFCIHDYDKLDRDRRTLHEFEVNSIILKIASIVSPEAAVVILEKMRLYWYSYPVNNKKIDVEGWSSIVNALVRRIWCSDDAILSFREKNPHLLCAARVFSTPEKNRRRQALVWASKERADYKIVKDTFHLLGYSFLEDECEKNGGFVESKRQPNEYEKQCFELLEALAENIFANYYLFDDSWPKLNVITNRKAICKGMASLKKRKVVVTNSVGLKVRYELHTIHMKEHLFEKDRFSEALATYVHELCHVFGGDSSDNFSNALTIAIEVLLEHNAEVEKVKKQWANIPRLKEVDVSNG